MALPGRVGRLLARGREAFPHGLIGLGGRGGRNDASALLTWDETAAFRAVGRRRGMSHFSGVIWLTDRPEGRGSDAMRRALGRCAGLWTLSATQVEPLMHLMGKSGPPVGSVRFGIDTEFFALQPYPERPLLVSVGGDRDRDPATLFAALERVRRARPDIEIIVQSRTKAVAPDGVKVIAQMSHVELRDLYRRMSIMVLATRPNLHVSGMTVSLESRATGRPVVITGTPGIDDYVSDDDAIVVATGDAQALADGVIGLLDDPDLGASMGRAGRANIESRHTERTMCDAILRIVTA